MHRLPTQARIFPRVTRAYCELNLGAVGLYVFLVVLLVVLTLVLVLAGQRIPFYVCMTFLTLYATHDWSPSSLRPRRPRLH